MDDGALRDGSSEDILRTDEELVALCRQGDGRAWEALIRRHQDRILNLAYQFTSNREEARDLAQDIFIRLYRKLNQYQENRPFRTWFNSLARNQCIDRYRQRKRDRVVVNTPSRPSDGWNGEKRKN